MKCIGNFFFILFYKIILDCHEEFVRQSGNCSS